MTSERDFDRLARAWLELGPDEAPDRVVAAVLQAAETTPQVRRRVAWPITEALPDEPSSRWLAGAAALIVAVIGGGASCSAAANPSGRRRRPRVPALSAGARPHRSPTPDRVGTECRVGVGPLPLELTPSPWVVRSPTRSDIHASRRRVRPARTARPLTPSAEWAIGNASEHVDLDRRSDRSAARPSSPARADAGQARHLAGDDASPVGLRCTARRGEARCCGNLVEAGTYASQYSRLASRQAIWQPDWGALDLHGPGGWANSRTGRTVRLTPSDAYANEGPDGPRDGSVREISAFGLSVAVSQDAACVGSPWRVSDTVDGLIGYVQDSSRRGERADVHHRSMAARPMDGRGDRPDLEDDVSGRPGGEPVAAARQC